MRTTTKENLQARPISDRRWREAEALGARRKLTGSGRPATPAIIQNSLELLDIIYVRENNSFYETRCGNKLTREAVNATLGHVRFNARSGSVESVGHGWRSDQLGSGSFMKASEWIMKNRAVDYVTSDPQMSKPDGCFADDLGEVILYDARVCNITHYVHPFKGAKTLNLQAVRGDWRKRHR
jgi:hypothetical protein